MGRAARTATRKKGRSPASATAASATTGGGGRWAELPEGLLLSVLDRLPSVADLFAVAAVCRSWRTLAGPPASVIIGGRPPFLLSPVLAPPLHSCHGGRWLYPRRCRLHSPADPAAASYRCLVPSGTLVSPVIGCSHGHLISCRGRRPLLADVVRGDVLRAPELPPDHTVRHGVLTAPLSAPGCDLLLLSSARSGYFSTPVLLRWRVGEGEWSEHPLEDEEGVFEPMVRITVSRGQIFALSDVNRLFTVEFSSHFGVRDLAVEWSTEDKRFGMHMCPYPVELVECDGELMLVRFVDGESWPSTKVEVFRLDLLGPPSWVRVENLGERALFIDLEHGSSVACLNPSRWGGRSNCIYLARRASDTWTVLPLDGEGTEVYDRLSPSDQEYDYLPTWPSPIWVYPSMLY